MINRKYLPKIALHPAIVAVLHIQRQRKQGIAQMIKASSSLKKDPMSRGGFLVYDANGLLIATAPKIKRADSDATCGAYRICWFGGDVHGKVNYAADFQHLNCVINDYARMFCNA